MINIDALSVRFGGVTALNQLSVRLEAGTIGIIGPNGAGKTTFLNVLSGFIRPAGGRLTAFGTDLLPLAPHQRARWGLRRSFQKEQVVDQLTVEDNIRVILDPLGLDRREREQALGAALDYTGIAALRRLPADQLNAYQRRMIEIARCLAGRPRLILLDEPGAGFSENEVTALRQIITGIPAATGAMTLLIDHDVDLIKATCARTMVLDFGALITYGDTAAVLADPLVRAVYLGTEEVA